MIFTDILIKKIKDLKYKQNHKKDENKNNIEKIVAWHVNHHNNRPMTNLSTVLSIRTELVVAVGNKENY
jgi:hypothetical protein